MATSFGAAIAGLLTNLGGIRSSNPSEVTNASIYLYSGFALAPLIAIILFAIVWKSNSPKGIY